MLTSPTVATMHVVKRSGKKESVAFDKISQRIAKLTHGLDPSLNIFEVTQKVVSGVYDGVSTVHLDTLAAHTAAQMTIHHPDYARLGGRILASNLQKLTSKSFLKTMKRFAEHVEANTGQSAPLVSTELVEVARKHAHRIEAAIVYERDLDFDYFGFKTLERSYLTRIDNETVERPQHMFMRVSLGVHGEDVDAAIETYELMSSGYFTHATPTLFHAGTPRPQMSSCFLMQVKEDSIDGIFETLSNCARISKHAGGIGVSISNVRASGSYIKGTGGVSNGLVPMLRVFDATARYVDQGGGKRKGSIAVYIEPWHADVEDFLDLRKNHGKEEARARDLFYALWVPDLFMKRIDEDGTWTLFCPGECPDLVETWGATFEEKYVGYEAAGKGKRTLKARDLWFKILDSQIETGTPYMLYKDAANAKSNQQHLGTLRCSNLCCEILEFVAPDEVAVCNLASIALPKFVKDGAFDFDELRRVTAVVTKNLNNVIDRNYYPIPEARNSNMRHRPIGIGVQGLADVFALMKMSFASDAARRLNRTIFEHIYHSAVDASCRLAERDGPYESFMGSPSSEGKLQFDLWQVDPDTLSLDWAPLKARIALHGMRNSLLVAPMPTASTAQILGNNECFEPFTSNIYTRRVLSGEFIIVNKHLVRDLDALGMWTPALRNAIIAQDGSVQHIAGIPNDIKELYKTAFEIPQKTIIDLAADRGAFIDQTQSLNLFVEDAKYTRLTSMHFYSWRKGLKTGMYYLRSKPARNAIAVTVHRGMVAANVTQASKVDVVPTKLVACPRLGSETCDICSA